MIRDLRPEDYPDVDRLMGVLHNMHVEARPDLYVPMDYIYSEEKYRSMLDSAEHIALGAQENGRIVGLCIAEIRYRSFMVDQCTVYVDDLIVDPSFRKRGIASALLKECEIQAVRSGAKRMDLMAWDFNKDALAFYEAHGMNIQRYIFEKTI